jgi:ATP10 protein
MTHHILCVLQMTSMASLSFAAAANELTVGDVLPELRGEYLSGRKATLPNDSSGHVALLLFGFTYESRFSVEAWTKRFRHDFEKNPQVTFYEIPMIGGMARLGKWFIDSGMRRETPKADRENVITVYGNTESWKQRLAVRAEDSAYLVIVDQKGNVAWRHAGPFEETSYQALAVQVRKLASAQ